MINLMPDDAKKELRAARTNVALTRYMGVILLAFAFLGLVLAGAYMGLSRTQASAQELIETNDTKAAVYRETEQQVEALSGRLIDAKTILDQEILYSRVLINIGQLMPADTVLDTMTLDSGSFSGAPTTLTVYAKSTQAAVAVQDNFKSSRLFNNVSFQTISDTSGIDGYPVSATMTFSLNRQVSL